MAPKTAMERLQKENEELRRDIRRLETSVKQLSAMLAGRLDPPAPATKGRPASFSAAVKGPPKPSVPRKAAAPKAVQPPPKKPELGASSPSPATCSPPCALSALESRKRRRDESDGEEETIEKIIIEGQKQKELQELGIKDAEAFQMVSRRSKEKLSLVLVKTANKDIWKISRLFNLSIKLEEKRKTRDPGQCFRCQRYGHSQRHCTQPVRCVKCGEGHRSADCQLPRPGEGEGRNCKCALCGTEGHPASWRGCPMYPKRKIPVVRREDRKTNPKRTSPALDSESLEAIVQAVMSRLHA